LATQARAFSCDDFTDVFKANIEEGLGYQSEFNSIASKDANQCHFVRDIFIPYTERTIVIMNGFAQCPKYKGKVAIAVGKTQGQLEILKGLLPKECK
jgi:hypothetical protein